MISPFHRLKIALTKEEPEPRTILTGALRGIRFRLSLRSQSQVFVGLFERETHPWLKRFASGIQTGIDVGSALGEHTLFLLARTNASKVYSFEPDQSLTEGFMANLALNRIDPSRLVLCSRLVGSTLSEEVVTLDSLGDDVQLPCLIKVDVDGAEIDVLEGSRSLNKRRGVRWIIETHSKTLEEDCVRILSDAGFKTRIVPNAWWRLFVPEMRPSDHNRWLAAWND